MKRSAARQPAARQRCQPVTAAFLEWRLCSLQAPPPEWLTRDRIQEVPASLLHCSGGGNGPATWPQLCIHGAEPARRGWTRQETHCLTQPGLAPGQEGQPAAGSPWLGGGLPSLSPKGIREFPAPLETCLCSWKTCSRQLTKLTQAPKGDSGMMKSSPGRGQAAWPVQGASSFQDGSVQGPLTGHLSLPGPWEMPSRSAHTDPLQGAGGVEEVPWMNVS